jgi:hypothetical protein
MLLGHAVSQFSIWCEGGQLALDQVQPIHVAGYIEQSAPISRDCARTHPHTCLIGTESLSQRLSLLKQPAP